MHSAGLLLKTLAFAALVCSAAAGEDQGQTTPAPVTKDPVTQTPPTKDPVTQTPPTKDPVTQAPPTKDPVTPMPTMTAAPTSMPPKNCSTLANKDRVGFDLGNVRGAVTACPNECAHTPGCITWTWSNYNSGTCWLKSRAGALIDKAGVTATECVNNVPSLVCNAFKDIDFVGMDIGSRPGKSFGDCCDVCNEFTGCTAYAWNDFNGGTCWLKKSVGQTEYKPGVTSSSLLPLYGGVCAAEYNVDFVGNDIGNKPSKDAGICCGQCKATAGCKAYTWSDYNGGTCWMKSGKGATAAKNGVTSATIAIF